MIILSDSHPYMANLTVSVWEYPNGDWIVKWRDFTSVKQDAVLSTFSQAQAYASRIREIARIVDLEQLECWDQTVQSMTEFWREVYPAK